RVLDDLVVVSLYNKKKDHLTGPYHGAKHLHGLCKAPYETTQLGCVAMRTSPFQQLWKLGLQRPLHDALRASWPASFSCGGLTASLHTIADPTASREQSRVAVFDGVVKARHRDRAAYLARLHEPQAGTLPLGLAPSCSNVAVPASGGQPTGQGPKSSYRHDPLLGTVADRLLDRLEDCVKTFPKAAIIGGAGGPRYLPAAAALVRQ
ncbi:hypothetical protein HaLaN_29283, partial [Haematococcus lacustris]